MKNLLLLSVCLPFTTMTVSENNQPEKPIYTSNIEDIKKLHPHLLEMNLVYNEAYKLNKKCYKFAQQVKDFSRETAQEIHEKGALEVIKKGVISLENLKNSFITDLYEGAEELPSTSDIATDVKEVVAELLGKGQDVLIAVKEAEETLVEGFKEAYEQGSENAAKAAAKAQKKIESYTKSL